MAGPGSSRGPGEKVADDPAWPRRNAAPGGRGEGRVRRSSLSGRRTRAPFEERAEGEQSVDRYQHATQSGCKAFGAEEEQTRRCRQERRSERKRHARDRSRGRSSVPRYHWHERHHKSERDEGAGRDPRRAHAGPLLASLPRSWRDTVGREDRDREVQDADVPGPGAELAVDRDEIDERAKPCALSECEHEQDESCESKRDCPCVASDSPKPCQAENDAGKPRIPGQPVRSQCPG